MEKREKGIVFTSPEVANQMIDLLDPEDLKKANTVLFEPNLGTGNVALEMIKRRFQAIRPTTNDPVRLFILTAGNVFGVEIDSELLAVAKKRIRELYLELFCLIVPGYILEEHLGALVDHHFTQNDMITGLCKSPEEAKEKTKKVNQSREWFEKNGFTPINFKSYFEMLGR